MGYALFVGFLGMFRQLLHVGYEKHPGTIS
jgi:hypothetical protein